MADKPIIFLKAYNKLVINLQTRQQQKLAKSIYMIILMRVTAGNIASWWANSLSVFSQVHPHATWCMSTVSMTNTASPRRSRARGWLWASFWCVLGVPVLSVIYALLASAYAFCFNRIICLAITSFPGIIGFQIKFTQCPSSEKWLWCNDVIFFSFVHFKII